MMYVHRTEPTENDENQDFSSHFLDEDQVPASKANSFSPQPAQLLSARDAVGSAQRPLLTQAGVEPVACEGQLGSHGYHDGANFAALAADRQLQASSRLDQWLLAESDYPMRAIDQLTSTPHQPATARFAPILQANPCKCRWMLE